MFGMDDVFQGFAIAFSTFKNKEVLSPTLLIISSLAITAISLSTSAMATQEPTSKTKTTPAATPATVSTKSAKTSPFPRFSVLIRRSTTTRW